MLLKPVLPHMYRNYHASLVCSYCLVNFPCQLSGTVYKCISSPSGFAVVNRYYAGMISHFRVEALFIVEEWGGGAGGGGLNCENCKTCRFAYWGESHVAVDILLLYLRFSLLVLQFQPNFVSFVAISAVLSRCFKAMSLSGGISWYFSAVFTLFSAAISTHLCVVRRHFCCPMSMFQGHHACRNYP